MEMNLAEIFQESPLFAKGIWVLMLSMSFWSLTVAVGKWNAMRKAAAETKKFAPEFDQFLTEEKLSEAIDLADQYKKSHVAKVLGAALGEWLAPPMQQLAKQHTTLQKMSGQGIGTLGATWVRDGRVLISVERRGGEGYGGVALFELDERNRLRSMAQATSIKFVEEGRWLLGQYAETTLALDATVAARRSVSEPFFSSLSADFFGDAASSPDQMSTLSVWRIVMHLRANGLDDREPLFAFWSRIARTVAIFFALLLAVPFVFGSLRDSGSGARVAMGFILGIGFFSLQRTLESGAIVFGGAPMLLAWTPTLLLATAALLLIMRTR
ncbi:MAG: LptF/LptG family permease [Steroidobacteraceae bacterium]